MTSFRPHARPAWQPRQSWFAVPAPIHCIEVAWQHFFGDSGFGFQANATFVNGDVGYNLRADPAVAQFALEGLSDSANAVLIYEKYGLSARLAYNWRDAFLTTTVYQ